jgi:hypothetical protein
MTSEERKAWLRSLKVGDLVASKFDGATDEQVSVERVSTLTDTIIETVDYVNNRRESRYRRGTGHQTLRYGSHELHPVTDSVMELTDRMMLKRAWSDWQYKKKLPITTVRKLLAILTEAEQGKENQ